ncbi:hypothetical protein F5141DRAFT_1146636 [Pisolithus sp. B1]|nr:hypothetical protein F5141DRAFT_1146636 [Pisolithus sp. B1]
MTDTPKPQPSTTTYPTTNMTSLTDAQLRQTITQLSNAANTQYQHYQPAHASSSQTQSTPAAKAYLKNIHTWSTSTTPRGSTRGRGRTKTVPVAPASVPAAPAFAAPPTLYAHHPVHIPGSVMGIGVGGVSGSTMPGLAAPAALPLPAPAPAPPTGPPNPPKHPLPVAPQASHSTYASRLRTGTTLLMQPILSGTSTSTSVTTGTTALTARPSTRRTTGMVNYAEPGSGDEFPDAGALDSDDSDFVASGGTRTAVRQSRAAARMGAGMSNGMGVFYSGNGASTTMQGGRGGVPSTPGMTSSMAAGVGTTEKVELGQSYLGMIPPSKFIKARPVGPTAYEYPSLDTLFTHAQTRTSLVPIRVEFDTDTHRIRDCFVWNLYETLVKPEMFARVFCADLELPVVPWAETVANQIRAQLEEHEGVASLDLGVEGWYGCDVGFQLGCRYGYVGGSVWDGRAQAEGEGNDQNWEEPLPESGGEVPECRVILSVSLRFTHLFMGRHGRHSLNLQIDPEDFSKQLCAELGLAGEAIPLIAHAIHEELIKHKRDAIEWGVIGGDHRESVAGPGALASGGGSEDAERRTGAGGGGGGGVLKDKTGLGLAWGRTPRENRGPKTLRSVWREWSEAEEFRMRFEELTAEEVEKREIERERASRRLRRETSKFQTTRTRRR